MMLPVGNKRNAPLLTAGRSVAAAKRLRLQTAAGADDASETTTDACLSPTNGSPSPLSATESKSRVGDYVLLAPFDQNGHCETALHVPTGEIRSCQRLNREQRDRWLSVTERLDRAPQLWRDGDAAALRQLVLPSGAELVRARPDCWLAFGRRHHGSLHAFVQSRRRLDEPDARRFFGQIVRLVAFCHALGIVLRDLKLRKFVFDDEQRDTLRLSDVDAVVVCADVGDDALSDRHGCPAYVSPELLDARRPPYSGSLADVWSLGVLLYVMLLGRYPFYDRSPVALFRKIRAGRVPLPPPTEGAPAALSAEARRLVLGLLRRDPSERPSAAALRRAPWLQPRPVAAVAPPTARTTSAATAAEDQVVPCM